MTQQEFEDRTGKTVTSEEYARIEAMYMAAGNMDKDQFCTESVSYTHLRAHET